MKQVSDEDCSGEIANQLTQKDIKPGEVSVACTGGTVTLSGTVNSNAKKDAAYEIAVAVGGDRNVINKITVKAESSLAHTVSVIATEISNATSNNGKHNF